MKINITRTVDVFVSGSEISTFHNILHTALGAIQSQPIQCCDENDRRMLDMIKHMMNVIERQEDDYSPNPNE